ncbi:MAG: UDP-N-acetylglucosamine 1-carboxyvinyltransferase [Candidatus Zambryskibacteria bacterium RIFCSPLOWO2_01_FULL_39_39]|uniref:UDP-N-acetylglucosamine 1-carboxyvinyltransferase n=1 Tax=Candidatus Zambryskibacteria bacterium RIFCSPLOWO2_01_FULL_39_39 TaxID=1802758 RepID=A0A1G2TXR3_9BACT|nr:MAG: UDP-N-acetylglucosamine 1-carboxyvinyltransferase [Parcubacteria group bacterium GW2011_GWA1_47_10]OHA86760.1 MAG: UDP-N-acetylglucosamine 1-carboxyvinyltransferase [Candidatus Zambryskibacteria bacterium RIFCSPHIGHO2_01_FULL_39_63]OHA94288.1 MAG: UDP-N-acetylglucosamine 1-carboxyvinyltransferase [Candidatus Zambryskibacteria bacterium RIFCSPHIGHO2_02_FULL_39_19]OHA98444.1 MAG: UDP-N-acetylglucosamine 1-carboxyvinyltransferase [Candidatus Zambryskibacteria bacterium RIFCSPHIGHO2_12_FULL_
MKNVDNQRVIGSFIKKLREKRFLTQEELAQRLNTSQSAVARMEAGGQNLTAGELLKIGDALEHKIVSLSDSVDFQICGGKKLKGKIKTNPSKNGAMGLLCASLLNKNTTTLHGIPRIEEVNRMLEIFSALGVKYKWLKRQTLEINPPKKFNKKGLLHQSIASVRSSIMLIPAMAYNLKNFSLLHAGGCKMGERTIAAHRYALLNLGILIKTQNKKYVVSSKSLRPSNIVMYEASDTATENAIMAAALAPGVTKISFAPPNYQVQEVCFFLEKAGVKIEGIGTTNLTVHGIKEINRKIEYYNSEDPIESMMFISAAITTGSKLEIERCPINFLSLELTKLLAMGLKCKISNEYLAENGKTKLVDIIIFPSRLKALRDKIHAQPYPGINSDNLPFFVPIATQAEGTTLIHDWMWENRAIYFTELNKLGANVTLVDPHRAFINGPTKFKPAQVVCPGALRPAMIILIAMLAAPGVSILRNVYSINRGYEDVALRLNSIGASIEKITGV